MTPEEWVQRYKIAISMCGTCGRTFELDHDLPVGLIQFWRDDLTGERLVMTHWEDCSVVVK